MGVLPKLKFVIELYYRIKLPHISLCTVMYMCMAARLSKTHNTLLYTSTYNETDLFQNHN